MSLPSMRRPAARSRLRAAVATAVLSWLIVGPATPASGAVVASVGSPAGPPKIPSSGLLFGASVTSAAGQSAAQAFAALENQLGRSLSLDRSYSRWDDAQPTNNVRDDATHGRIPLLSISARRKDGTIVSWSSIATGAQDAVIRAAADALRDTGLPMILTFQHEPEFAVGFGTAADYVAAFRHYVAVFRAENATNIAFSIVLGAGTYSDPSRWYPGDDVVDWIGADAYNFAGCTAGVSGWRSLSQAAGAFYQWGSARGKPLLLAEWGSAEDPTQPGRKAAWFNDALATFAGWPQLKAAAYFDRVGSCDWRLDTSASSLSAFNDLAHSAIANGAPTGRLIASTPVGPAPLVENFGLSASTGSGSPTGTGIASWSIDFGDGSTVSGTGEPTSVGHTYAAGHWTATLIVVDPSGLSAYTSVTVIAAPPPTVSEGNPSSITSTTAILPAWISTSSLPGSYYFQWGLTTGYGSQSMTSPLLPLDSTQAVAAPVAALQPATRYHWRAVATTAAGTTYGPDRYFTTAAA